MSDYQKYDIAGESNDITENYEPLYKNTNQNLKLKDNKRKFYKLGVKPACNEVKYPHTTGYIGKIPKPCKSNHINENSTQSYCDINPWYCNKHY